MTFPGVKTTDFDNRVPLSDEVIVNRAGSTGIQTVGDLAQQLAADGPLAEAIEGAAVGLLRAASLAGLPAGTRAGQPAEVTAGPDRGSYSWSGAAWVKIGDLIDPETIQESIDALDATKADQSVLAAVAGDLDAVAETADGLEASYGASKTDRVAQIAHRFARSGYSAVNVGANGRILEAVRDRDNIKVFGADGIATKHVERHDFAAAAFSRSPFLHAEVGEQRRVSSGRDRDGRIYFGGKPVALADDFFVYTATVAGKSHVFSETHAGRRLKLSSGAYDNTGPLISGNCCVWTSDRGAGPTLYYSPLNKAVETRVIPLQQIACWGDSLTEHNYALGMRTALGIPVHNLGKSGQTSSAVVARMRPTPLVVSGNQIPASGAVTVSCLDGLGPVGYYFGTAGSVDGVLNGVAGTLAWVPASQTMTFTRTTSGSTIAAPPGSLFVWTPKDSVLNTTISDPVRQMMQIFFSGRNNATEIDRIFADFEAAVSLIETGIRRFLIVPYLPQSIEIYGTQAWALRETLLHRCRDRWPENTVDLLPVFLANGNGSTADNTAIANRVPPPSLMFDTVHPNNPGIALEAATFSNVITAKGWI